MISFSVLTNDAVRELDAIVLVEHDVHVGFLPGTIENSIFLKCRIKNVAARSAAGRTARTRTTRAVGSPGRSAPGARPRGRASRSRSRRAAGRSSGRPGLAVSGAGSRSVDQSSRAVTTSGSEAFASWMSASRPRRPHLVLELILEAAHDPASCSFAGREHRFRCASTRRRTAAGGWDRVQVAARMSGRDAGSAASVARSARNVSTSVQRGGRPAQRVTPRLQSSVALRTRRALCRASPRCRASGRRTSGPSSGRSRPPEEIRKLTIPKSFGIDASEEFPRVEVRGRRSSPRRCHPRSVQ